MNCNKIDVGWYHPKECFICRIRQNSLEKSNLFNSRELLWQTLRTIFRSIIVNFEVINTASSWRFHARKMHNIYSTYFFLSPWTLLLSNNGNTEEFLYRTSDISKRGFHEENIPLFDFYWHNASCLWVLCSVSCTQK